MEVADNSMFFFPDYSIKRVVIVDTDEAIIRQPSKEVMKQRL